MFNDRGLENEEYSLVTDKLEFDSLHEHFILYCNSMGFTWFSFFFISSFPKMKENTSLVGIREKNKCIVPHPFS